MTGISRILGFVRDVVIARLFGAGVGADAFFVAFRIPNLFRRLFAEGAFSQSFVPVLSEYRTRHDEAEVRDLIEHVTGWLGGILLVFTAVGMLAAPLVVSLFAPGFIGSPEKFALTVEMLRITFPYLFFISLTAMAGGILNTWGRFGVPAFTPVFLNLAMIGAAFWLAPLMDQPIVALAWGVFIGGVVQLLFQLPFLRRLRLLPRPRLRRGHAGVGRIMKLILPAVFGASVTQINLLIDTLIASFLVTGSVSWLYFSDRMVEFPLGIFGIALATVMLPSLSRHHANDDPARFSANIDWALRWVILLSVPAAIGLAVLAGPILTTLFQYGAFSIYDTEMSRLSLMAYAIGLVGFMGVKVLAPAFYSRQDMRTPVRIGIIALLVNLVLNLSLVFTLAHAGLALATSMAALVNATLLLSALRRAGVYTPLPGWQRLLAQLSLASVGMAVLLLGFAPSMNWSAWDAIGRASALLILVGAGFAVFMLLLLLSGWRWSHMTVSDTPV